MSRRLACGLPAVLGGVFCVLSALGFKELCVTAGCAVYAGAAIFGLPVYWLGALAFAAIALTCLVPRLWPLAPALTALLLAGDVLFLAYQTVFLPCLSCLIVAVCLAAAFLAAARRRGRGLALLAVWGLLAASNAIDAAREQVRPWPIHGDPATATVEVFFSMECPKCRQTLRELLPDAAAERRIALYPVAKSEADAAELARLHGLLRGGQALRDALETVWRRSEPAAGAASSKPDGPVDAPGRPAPVERAASDRLAALAFDARLAWNKALLIRSGRRTAPVVLSSGPTGRAAPAAQAEDKGSAAGPSPKTPAGDLPLFAPKPPASGLDLGECREGEEKGCDI